MEKKSKPLRDLTEKKFKIAKESMYMLAEKIN